MTLCQPCEGCVDYQAIVAICFVSEGLQERDIHMKFQNRSVIIKVVFIMSKGKASKLIFLDENTMLHYGNTYPRCHNVEALLTA